ncbi:MAG: hypothetical protein J5964_07795 [Eubacterium sp.]|nr:hypothetical protein [Eubacterium sp.]
MENQNNGVNPQEYYNPNTPQQPQYQQPAQQGTYQQPQYQQPMQQGAYQQPQYQQPMQQGAYQQPQYQQPMQQGAYQQPQYQQPVQQGTYQQPQGYSENVATKKKKRTTPLIIVAVLLVIAIISGVSSSLSKGPEKKFYGEWTSKIDVTDSFMQGADEVEKYIKGVTFDLTLNYTFNEDGTYTLVVDREAYEETIENMYPTLATGMLAYVRDQYSYLSAYTDEEIIETIEENTGESYEDYIRSIFSDSLDYDNFADMFNSEGNYKADKDKLWLSAGYEYNVDETSYYIYEINSDNEITLKEYYENNIIVPDEPVMTLNKD